MRVAERGVFKYVLIDVRDGESGETKRLVRGYAFAEYHGSFHRDMPSFPRARPRHASCADDVYQHVRPGLEALGLTATVAGGGRIHRTDDEILVYGYSVVRAPDHRPGEQPLPLAGPRT
jgi:hypothetical protein